MHTGNTSPPHNPSPHVSPSLTTRTTRTTRTYPPHSTGYCGTFGRVAAAEGQFALRSGHGLRNFSEEELVDCIGWDKDQVRMKRGGDYLKSERRLNTNQ